MHRYVPHRQILHPETYVSYAAIHCTGACPFLPAGQKPVRQHTAAAMNVLDLDLATVATVVSAAHVARRVIWDMAAQRVVSAHHARVKAAP